MSLPISIPSRSNYIQLRRDEPILERANTRWQKELKGYCSDVAKLAKQIANGSCVKSSYLARVDVDLDKIEKHALSKAAKTKVQKTRELLTRAKTEPLNRFLKQSSYSQESNWKYIPTISSLRNLSLRGILTTGLYFLSFVIPGAAAQAATESPNFDTDHPVPCSGVVVSASLEGSFGDQLFEVATAHAYAKTIGAEPVFPANKALNPVMSKINRFSDFEPAIPVFDDNGSLPPTEPVQSLKLRGFFQNPKYFEHRKKEIIELFTPTTEMRESLYEKYPVLHKNTVAVHVHKGNYASFKLGNDTLMHNLAEDMGYYKEALQNFDKENQHFVIFSDDIEFAKNLPAFKELPNVTFFNEKEGPEAFQVMTLCKNHIIANNSLSWWAAYVGEKPGQKIVMPAKWWHPDIGRKWNDPQAEYPCGHYGLLKKDWIIAGKNSPIEHQETDPNTAKSSSASTANTPKSSHPNLEWAAKLARDHAEVLGYSPDTFRNLVVEESEEPAVAHHLRMAVGLNPGILKILNSTYEASTKYDMDPSLFPKITRQKIEGILAHEFRHFFQDYTEFKNLQKKIMDIFEYRNKTKLSKNEEKLLLKQYLSYFKELASHCRNLEHDADMSTLSHPPSAKGLIDFLASVGKIFGGEGVSMEQFELATHPMPKDRIAYLTQELCRKELPEYADYCLPKCRLSERDPSENESTTI